jgi:hypothetical protein
MIYQVISALKKDMIALKAFNLTISDTEGNNITSLFLYIVDWVYSQSCAFIQNLTVESGSHSYAIEIHIYAESVEIFTDEPEAIRYVIDPRSALIVVCEELKKEIMKKL